VDYVDRVREKNKIKIASPHLKPFFGYIHHANAFAFGGVLEREKTKSKKRRMKRIDKF